MKKIATQNIILCGLFAGLIAIGAFIKIPVPYVPFTLQFLFTNLAGLLLGKKYGALSVIVYILVGLAGLPVFTGGGGISYILYPTFGYIVGFAIGAFVTGLMAEKNTSVLWLLLSGFVGLMIIYAVGVPYYYFIANYYIGNSVGVWTVFLTGFLLCVPGDLIICILCALLGNRLMNILRKVRK